MEQQSKRRIRKNGYEYSQNRLCPGAIRGCAEVAEMMGLSVVRVQQLDRSALAKLRAALAHHAEKEMA